MIMKKLLDDATITKLRKSFAEKSEILSAYIFGSQVGGFALPKSDLDLAVFVSDREKISEREIGRLLEEAKIDIHLEPDVSCVDLASPPLFLYQIIKNGVCIYEKDSRQRIDLEAKILDIYFDNQYLRNVYHHYLQKSLKERTYGR